MGFGGGAENPEFNFEYMKGKSSAAAGLCDWVVNICIYHDIYLDVAPKRKPLPAARPRASESSSAPRCAAARTPPGISLIALSDRSL